MIWKNIKLKTNLRKLIKKNEEIEDIIVFGSLVRGKIKPNDIDIIVIFKNKVNKDIEYEIRKEIEKEYNNISIISKTKENILDEAFDARESILFEGISLLSDENLADKYGFSSLGMFKYKLTDFNSLKKTKFYHTLNGRSGKEGIVNKLDAIKISDNLIFVPIEKIEEFKEFLELWNINYTYIPTLIPKRLNKKSILEK